MKLIIKLALFGFSLMCGVNCLAYKGCIVGTYAYNSQGHCIEANDSSIRAFAQQSLSGSAEFNPPSYRMNPAVTSVDPLPPPKDGGSIFVVVRYIYDYCPPDDDCKIGIEDSFVVGVNHSFHRMEFNGLGWEKIYDGFIRWRGNYEFACPSEEYREDRSSFFRNGAMCVKKTDAIGLVLEAPEYCGGPNGLGFGHPIFPATGSKRTEVRLGIEDLSIIYNSMGKLDSESMLFLSTGIDSEKSGRARQILSPLWNPSWVGESKPSPYPSDTGVETFSVWTDGDVLRQFRGEVGKRMYALGGPSFAAISKSSLPEVRVFHAEGKLQIFETLVERKIVSNGYVDVYSYRVSDEWSAKGEHRKLSYSSELDISSDLPIPGLLKEISIYGRPEIKFGYEYRGPGRAKLKWVDQAGKRVILDYNQNGFISSIKWPDTNSRLYLYELDAGLLPKPWALTGEIREDGIRFATYEYKGDAASKTYVGNKFSSYTDSGARFGVAYEDFGLNGDGKKILRKRWLSSSGEMIDPLGTAGKLTFKTINGNSRIIQQNQAAGSGCGASSASMDYDEAGNITSRTGFDGNRTCIAYDPVRPLEILRLEGGKSVCPANLPTYSIPAGLGDEEPQRLIHTQWHPVWAQTVRVAEPKRITTTVYNGQPDPLNSGSIAKCVPAGAALPVSEIQGETTPLAVVCKLYEQATNDLSGQLGFDATEVSRRSWSYLYNNRGQLTQATDPLGQVTNYSYFETTGFEGELKSELGEAMGHHIGDLNTVSISVNGIKQTTTHTHYNKWGQVLRSVFPNGNVEERAYNPRGALRFLRTRSADGSTDSLLTEYTYHPTGLLDTIVLPDESWRKYAYDSGHRLTKIEDHLGNLVEYTLDGAGNRLEEKHLDAQGVRQKIIVRTYDALGRMQTEALLP